ncbi:MAG: DUF1559 domain-containing protein, partial [Planctomycetaceae bacterium]|nr:DUF1559 domain-containing protein [Planctomycetaceae bacterium]
GQLDDQRKEFLFLPNSLYSYSFSSGHPGGVNILLGDGSARFLKDSVDRSVYLNLSQIADAAMSSDSGF